MSYVLNSPWVFGLIVVSGLVGIIGSFIFFLVLLCATGAKAENIWSREFFYAGFLTGVVERFFFTCIIGLLGSSGIAQAIVGWIAIIELRINNGYRTHARKCFKYRLSRETFISITYAKLNNDLVKHGQRYSIDGIEDLISDGYEWGRKLEEGCIFNLKEGDWGGRILGGWLRRWRRE
jgi:hypothetical protein